MADLFIIGQFEGVAGTTAVLDRQPGHAHAHGYDRGTCGWGTTVSIGQAIGAKRQEEGGKCHRKYGHTVCCGGGRHAFAILLLLVNPIPSGLCPRHRKPWQVPGSTFTICFVGIPFIIAYNVISSDFSRAR